MMPEIGSVISAHIFRIEPYGLYLEQGGQTIIVLAPDVSWKGKGDLRDRFHIGDQLKVQVLGFNYKKGEIIGSIKRLHPEENPYRQLSRLEPGTVLTGKVLHGAGNEVTVELENGAWGDIPKRLLPVEPAAGELLYVTIAGLYVDEGRLWLEPAPNPASATNGPTKTPPTVAKV